jgi:hypothetical protein
MIDVTTEFAKDEEPGRFYAYPGSHYSAVGYRVAARAIVEALDRAPR